MKKNKLYTVNKWNKSLFATDIDRTYQNVFDGMFGSNLNTPTSDNDDWLSAALDPGYAKNIQNSYVSKDYFLSNDRANTLMGNSGPQVSLSSVGDLNKGVVDIANSTMQGELNTAMQHGDEGIKNFKFPSKDKNLDKAQTLKALGNVGLSLADTIGQSDKFKRGMWDRADPLHYLAGGRESAVGNAMGDAGVSLFKSGAQSGNGSMMIAGAALKGIGSLTNAAFGTAVDKERLTAMNAGIDSLNAFNSNASSFDDVKGPNAIVDNTNGMYKDGWFTNSAAKKQRAMHDKVVAAESRANRSVENNIDNISDNQMDTMLANYAAYGGPLGRTVNPADYDFISDYLLTRSKINRNNKYALGGDIQSNGGDYTTGLAHIDAGGSHEENPYDGVQVGISTENGNPNLVEEGETIFDDYVFSNRIEVDDTTKEKFHIAKKRKMTFADLSKKLEKESLERPNDPISQAGLRRQMQDLADNQERQKQEMQEREAEESFEKLPPEQQQMIMEQLALEEEQARQQQMQGQQEEVPQEETSTEQQLAEEQMMQQQQPQLQEGYEPQLNAYGGNMNRFDNGGNIKKDIYSLFKNIYTDSDFTAWARENGINPNKINWEKALEDPVLMSAITKSNPAAAHALRNHYDFGKFKRSNENKFNIDFKYGGWGAEDYNAWNGSSDPAWVEAVEKGLVKEGMNSEEIGNALKQTDAYKRGTEWLKASDANRLRYLQAILSSEEAPQAAKDYASRFIDKNGWKKDAKTDYQTIFEDPNSMGVRNTHPGTYWKTAPEMIVDNVNKNFVINDDGSVEEILTDVPKEWALANNYAWQDANSNYNFNYYKRSNAAKEENDNKKPNYIMKPKHKDTWQRDAGLMGPSLALGLQMSGVGKPKTEYIDKAEAIANEAPVLANASFLGNYFNPTLLDINREYNKLMSSARATDRAIVNNASPIGTKNAGLVANGYNTINAMGDLDIKDQDYNNNWRYKQAEFNRGTDQYNADAATKISMANADILNRDNQFKAQMAMQAAKEKMEADASWYKGIYGNINNAFKGLADVGKENAQYNMVADMAADGLFGPISDLQNIGHGILTKVPIDENGNPIETKRNVKACGGKIKRRKRGLTF